MIVGPPREGARDASGIPALVLAALSAACGGFEGPQIVSVSLPAAHTGLYYELQIEARGGRLPLAFRVIGGDLPRDVHLSTDGRLRGFPADPGDFRFRVEVRDEADLTDSARFLLHVDGEVSRPLEVPPQDLPRARQDEPYLHVLEAVGGAPPIEWTVVDGGLPEGVGVDPDGTVHGEPLEHGGFGFTVRARDGAGDTDEATLALLVTEAVDLVTERVPPTELGAPYDVALVTRGGVPPYSYEAIRGDLPPGIEVLDDGRLRGAGTEDGSWAFSVRASDAEGFFDDELYRLHVVDGLVRIVHPDVLIGDACHVPPELVEQPFDAALDIERSGSLAELDVYVAVEYSDTGFLSLLLTSPDGLSVLLWRYAGPTGGSDRLETIFDAEAPPASRLDVFAGQNPVGTWTLTALVHRADEPWIECPGTGRIAGFGLLLRFDDSSEDYVRSSGWEPNNLVAEPWARVVGGGLDESSFTITLHRWTAGANRIREGGEGDDEDLGELDVSWSTNLRPEQGTIDAETGFFQAGEETGRRRDEVLADGPGLLFADEGGGLVHEFVVRVVPPDWVP